MLVRVFVDVLDDIWSSFHPLATDRVTPSSTGDDMFNVVLLGKELTCIMARRLAIAVDGRKTKDIVEGLVALS